MSPSQPLCQCHFKSRHYGIAVTFNYHVACPSNMLVQSLFAKCNICPKHFWCTANTIVFYSLHVKYVVAHLLQIQWDFTGSWLLKLSQFLDGWVTFMLSPIRHYWEWSLSVCTQELDEEISYLLTLPVAGNPTKLSLQISIFLHSAGVPTNFKNTTFINKMFQKTKY